MRIPARTVLTLAFCLSADIAAAQETRAEAIARTQAQKATQLSEEGPDKAERAIVRVMSSPLLAGTGGFYPWFGSVYEGTSFGLGVGYLHRMPRASQLTVASGASVTGSAVVSAAYSAPRLFGDRLAPYVSARWARAQNVSFYGLGNESTKDRTGYDIDPMIVTAGATFHVAPRLAISADYQSIGFRTEVRENATSGDVLAALSDGQRLGFNASRLGIAFDTRTSPGYSTRGTLLRATTGYFAERNDRPFEFAQNEFEAVQLVPLVREQFVLAFRVLATYTNADSGNSVPLPLLPYLGSGTTLRGYANRRFVDRDRLVLNGEYRWRPSRFVDMALFLDAGQVAAEARDFRSSAMHTSWGMGVRFHGPTFTALRFDVAHSKEGLRLIFTTGAPF